MSSGARSIRVAPADPAPPRSLPLDLPRVVSAFAALALVAALLVPPGAFAATRDWTLSASPTSVALGAATVQVTATNIGDDGDGEAIGCVVIAIPKSAFTVRAVRVDTTSHGYEWYATFSGNSDTWHVILFAEPGGMDHLHGQPNESVTASIDVSDMATVGAFDWIGNAFNLENCTGDFLLPRTVSISVGGGNRAPQAASDAYATTKGIPLVIALPGVLANDADPDGDPITAVEASPPAHGSLLLGADGSFLYTPLPGFAGLDAFAYVASDGTASSPPADVTITVANTPPITAPDGPYVIAEDTTLEVGAPGVLGNDLDADGDPLSAVLESSTTGGALTLAPDGSFSYVPEPDASGPDAFTYRASDGTDEGTSALVSITVLPVNDRPDAEPDAYATAEDTTLSVPAPGVLANDTDRDGDALSATLLTPPATGTLVLAPSGAFTYTPAKHANGTVTFTYKARDAVSASDPVTVTLDITPVNDAPTAADDLATAAHGESVRVDVLKNDDDVDGDPLAIVSVTAPAHGTASIVGGAIRYDAPPGFAGTVSFRYTVTDGSADDSADVRIVVRPPEASPTPDPTPSDGSGVPPVPAPTASPAPAAPAPSATATSTPRPSPRPSTPGPSAEPDAAPPTDAAPPPAGLVPLPVAELTAVPSSRAGGFGSFGGLFGGLAGTGITWAVPAAVLGLPSLLFMMAIAAQLLGALAWIPTIRRSLAGLGASYRRRRRTGEADPAPRWRPSS